jgi:DNA-directed RNA polymerase specialized sigma24 family protein
LRKMTEQQMSATELAAAFERERRYLWTVAVRMLGSGDDADDAVQEAGYDSTAPAATGSWISAPG